MREPSQHYTEEIHVPALDLTFTVLAEFMPGMRSNDYDLPDDPDELEILEVYLGETDVTTLVHSATITQRTNGKTVTFSLLSFITDQLHNKVTT